MKQPSQGSTSATRLRTLKYAAIVLCYLLSTSLVVAQRVGRDKAWQELVSTEGRFRVLMPDTPEDRFVPVIGQIVNTASPISAGEMNSRPVASARICGLDTRNLRRGIGAVIVAIMKPPQVCF